MSPADAPSIVSADIPLPVALADHQDCPATSVLRRIGDRWSVILLMLLGRRDHRFNELLRSVEGISQRMLTLTLRSLERDGLVVRTVRPTVPPGVEYSLSALGRGLLVPLSAVADWADQHALEIDAARARHEGWTG
ncbi:helix-turn-helix transcriptional regulator [Saccharopolyspora indica]|uniref:winged helix-turn-helix transcriptional regulator n=1 Tax=Saccharopolyspora indica TaxID=1229659 RepID=UPI0022EB02AF|nr:helix-turn-helix domain-containing protein [Saccharopolyspora indica]MDA3645681.1 helix-turn-helix domain-containing protein [Saccharopolyspora indica]